MITAVMGKNKRYGIGKMDGYIDDGKNKTSYYQNCDKFMLDDYKNLSERLKTSQKPQIKINIKNKKYKKTDKRCDVSDQTAKYGDKVPIKNAAQLGKTNSKNGNFIKNRTNLCISVNMYQQNLNLEGINRQNGRLAVNTINKTDSLESYLKKLKEISLG